MSETTHILEAIEHSQDIERYILATLMQYRDSIYTAIDCNLEPAHFVTSNHGLIYRAITGIRAKGMDADVMTVKNRLQKEGSLDSIGGVTYLVGLNNGLAQTSSNFEYACRSLQQAFTRRVVREIGFKLEKSAEIETNDIFEVIEAIEKDMSPIREILFKKGFVSFSDAALEFTQDLDSKTPKRRGIPTGFEKWDDLFFGLMPGMLYIIAGRPAMGKTAFIISMMANQAKRKIPVGFFSLEMPKEEIIQRIYSMESGVPGRRIMKRDLTNDDLEKIHNATSLIGDLPIFVDDSAGTPISDLRFKARKLVAEKGVKAIYIDYLQLMKGERSRNGNREQEISSISQGLKELAKELRVPVIALSQLNRSVETRGGDKKPQLSDLRESGAIEQDADAVAFLYRPEYYEIYTFDDGQSTKGVAQVLVRKFRHGQGYADLDFAFDGPTTKFSNIDPGYGSNYRPISEIENEERDQLPF